MKLCPVLSNVINISLCDLLNDCWKSYLFERFFRVLLMRKEMLFLSFPSAFFSAIICFSNTFPHYCEKMLFGMEFCDRISSKKLRKSLQKTLSTYMMKASLSPSNACDGITFTGRWVNDLKKKEEREERIVRPGVSLFAGCTISGGRKTIKRNATLLLCLWGLIHLPLISAKWNSKGIGSDPQQHKFETNHCQINNNHNLLSKLIAWWKRSAAFMVKGSYRLFKVSSSEKVAFM